MTEEAREAEWATAEIRQRANSYDGVPNAVFDAWIAEHDRAIHAAGVREGIRRAREAAYRKMNEFGSGGEVLAAIDALEAEK